MKKTVVFMLSVMLINASGVDKKIDDWDSNATKQEYVEPTVVNSSGMGGNIAPVMAMPSPAIAPMKMSKTMVKRKIGLAVGGAKDSDNFIQNIKNGYIPKLKSITYEGVFYDHYFKSNGSDCKELFCPSYSLALSSNIYTNKDEYYISVGLDSGVDVSKFKRDKLNLVVVLDVSGSMSSGFNRYYYDGKHSHKKIKSKMQVANETIVNMLKHLKDDDRLAIVLFDNRAYRVKPFRSVKTTDMKAISKHILDIKSMGGTNWSAGYKAALEYFDGVSKDGYENRIIFITDAMPNMGELKKDRLFGMSKSAAKRGIHTTFLGVGVDFNANLVDYVSKVKGANYYSVHSAKEFAKRLDNEFDYMVTPLVYNLKLALDSKDFEIDSVYGVPNAKKATSELISINTLFASSSSDDGNKGGVILVKLKKIHNGKKLSLKVSYKDKHNKSYSNKKDIEFDIKSGYEGSAIQKAIVLSRYVTLMQNWILDARAGCNDKLDYTHQKPIHIMQRCMVYPPQNPYIGHIKTWERKSCKLLVSAGYKKIFNIFKNYFKSQMKQLGDKSLKKELEVLDMLTKDNLDLIDDYNNIR
jgi:Ca-activated chloride channel family protein